MQSPQEPTNFETGRLMPKFPSIRAALGLGSRNNTISSRSIKINRVVREAEVARFHGSLGRITSKYPKLAMYLAGASAVSVVFAIMKGAKISSAKSEIENRKNQLSKETYELKGTEAVNFPWNKENLNEWLYRPVRITGRPLHNKAMLIPRLYNGYAGFDYIVPLVTKENEDGSEKEGILLNKGWIPHEYAHVGSRWRIENALPQTFDCYVSLNSELDEKNSLFKGGNSFGERRSTWSHLYLPDMAEHSGFKNTKTVQMALLEAINHDSILDERLPKHFSVDLIGGEDHPYKKTLAGALQLKHMPWDLRAEQNTWLSLGVVLGGVASVVKFLA